MTIQTMGYVIDIGDDCECEISNDEKTIKVRSRFGKVSSNRSMNHILPGLGTNTRLIPRSGVSESILSKTT